MQQQKIEQSKGQNWQQNYKGTGTKRAQSEKVNKNKNEEKSNSRQSGCMEFGKRPKKGETSRGITWKPAQSTVAQALGFYVV